MICYKLCGQIKLLTPSSHSDVGYTKQSCQSLEGPLRKKIGLITIGPSDLLRAIENVLQNKPVRKDQKPGGADYMSKVELTQQKSLN